MCIWRLMEMIYYRDNLSKHRKMKIILKKNK